MNEERVQTLRKLVQMDPTDTFSKYALGLEFLEKFPDLARKQFYQVLEQDELYVAAYFQLGKLSFDQDDQKAAREWLEKGIRVADQVGDSHASGEMAEFLDEMD